MELSDNLKKYLKANKDKIEDNNFYDLVNNVRWHEKSSLVDFLYIDCNIDIFEYFNDIPICCYQGGKNIKKLDLTEYDIKNIEMYSFAESSIEYIKLPDSTLAIYKQAFNQSKLKEIFIPANVNYIGEKVFDSCKDLISIKFDENINLKIIENNTFYHCGISNITIPKSVQFIDYSAFECESLKDVTILNPNIKLHENSFPSFNKLIFSIPKNSDDLKNQINNLNVFEYDIIEF